MLLFGCFVKGPFNTQRGVKNLIGQYGVLHPLHPQCGCSSVKMCEQRTWTVCCFLLGPKPVTLESIHSNEQRICLGPNTTILDPCGQNQCYPILVGGIPPILGTYFSGWMESACSLANRFGVWPMATSPSKKKKSPDEEAQTELLTEAQEMQAGRRASFCFGVGSRFQGKPRRGSREVRGNLWGSQEKSTQIPRRQVRACWLQPPDFCGSGSSSLKQTRALWPCKDRSWLHFSTADP